MPDSVVLPRLRTSVSEVLTRCLDCDYPRLGLEPRQPCPECGAIPPPPEALVVVGSSGPGSPLRRALFMAGWSGFFLLNGLGLLWIRGFTLDSMIGSGFFAFTAVALAIRAWDCYRVRGKPGDVIWVIGREEVQVRSPLAPLFVDPLRSYAGCSLRSSFLRRWHRLRLRPRLLTIIPHANLWMRCTRAEAKALRDEIRARLSTAQERPDVERKR